MTQTIHNHHNIIVDGSYSPQHNTSAWGLVYLVNQNYTDQYSGPIKNCTSATRSEAHAVLEAVHFCIFKKIKTNITIYNDCKSIIQYLNDIKNNEENKIICNHIKEITKKENLEINFVWKPNIFREEHHLAHHLANSERLKSYIQNNKKNRSTSKRKRENIEIFEEYFE